MHFISPVLLATNGEKGYVLARRGGRGFVGAGTGSELESGIQISRRKNRWWKRVRTVERGRRRLVMNGGRNGAAISD